MNSKRIKNLRPLLRVHVTCVPLFQSLPPEVTPAAAAGLASCQVAFGRELAENLTGSFPRELLTNHRRHKLVSSTLNSRLHITGELYSRNGIPTVPRLRSLPCGRDGLDGHLVFLNEPHTALSSHGG